MKDWLVTVPISGTMELAIEAETEEEAVRMATEECNITHLVEWDVSGDVEAEETEWS